MQKKIIALAILGLTSTAAFADATVYGVVDGGVANLSGSGQQSQFLAQTGGLSESRLGVKAVEKMDDGLTAVAVLEYGLPTQDASGLAGANTRQELLGLAGDFGTVATGYLQSTGFDFGMKYDPFADGGASVLQSLTGAGAKGGAGAAVNGNNNFLIGSNALAAHAPRALAYISPSMGGVVVALNYTATLGPVGNLAPTATLGNAGAASSAANNNSSAWLASAAYDNGPLSVSLVYASANLSNLLGSNSTNVDYTATSTEYAVGASYDFKVLKLNATYQSNKQSTSGLGLGSTTNSAYSVSATVPAGPGTVALEYAANNMTLVDNSVSGSAVSATGYSLAYLQGLSKTVTVYGAFSSVTNGSGTNAFGVLNNATSGGTWADGGSTTLVALGLNKKF